MYSGIYGTNSYGAYVPPQMPVQPQVIDRVNGKNGADMYHMAPNSSVLLLDENDPIVWFVKTDGAGYKTIIPYDIKPHEEEPVPDVRGIDARLNSFDERLRVIEEALK